MSPLDGLPPQSVSRLVAMFHDLLPAKPGAPLVSATQQLDAIEANLLRGGAMWKDRDIQYRLHQLAGSSLQAGAAALGRSIRELKEAIANEQVIDAAEDENGRDSSIVCDAAVEFLCSYKEEAPLRKAILLVDQESVDSNPNISLANHGHIVRSI
jgi:hypothetical protein